MATAEIIVIGAGISGLTAAFTLHRAKRSVLVLEAGAQPGGLIQTLHENGYRMEAGPNTFPNTAAELLNLCRQLGLQPKATHPLADKRFLYLHGRLLCLPQNPLQAVTSPVLSLGAKWRVLQEPRQPKTTDSDTSVAEFFSRRVGPEVVSNLVDPFIGGIYAGDLTKLSLPAVFPQLWQWEQTDGSMFQGARKAKHTTQAKRAPLQLLGFENGLATLPQTLASALPPEALQVGQTVTRIQPLETGYRITTHTGTEYQGTHVILALPAYAVAPLLQPFLPEAAQPLAEIPYNGLAVAHTGFAQEDIPHPLDGFGCLIPRHANLLLLGSIWASSIFPDRAPMGHLLLSNFIGGAHHPEVAAWPEERILQTVCDNLQQVFKTRQTPQPVFQRVLTYQRAIPQYTLGHRERIYKMEQALQAHPTIQLCGNYLHGIALNECVKSGLAAAERIISPQ
jgi:oxygen-dependent protoporphyrinogen oxidase